MRSHNYKSVIYVLCSLILCTQAPDLHAQKRDASKPTKPPSTAPKIQPAKKPLVTSAPVIPFSTDDWPVSPPPLTGQHIYFDPFESSAPKGDSFKLVDQTGRFKGQIVYLSDIDRQRSIVFRSLGRQRTFSRTGSTVANYGIAGPNRFFNPMWMHDGKGVYFNYGDEYVPGNGSQVYQWDFGSRALRHAGPYSMQIAEINWSPGKEFASFLMTDVSWEFVLDNTLFLANTKERFNVVVLPETSDARVSWTPTGTMLFSSFYSTPIAPQTATTPPSANAPATTNKPARPNVYELEWNRSKITEASLWGKLLITEATNPAASPNGKWVAYNGWLTVDAEGNVVPSGTPSAKEREGLCLFERATGKRTWLRPQKYGLIQWFPDSREILLVNRGGMGASFYKLSLNTALLDAQSPELISAELKLFGRVNELKPTTFQFTSFSNDRLYAFFKVEKREGEADDRFRSLRALDLATGELITVFDFGNTTPYNSFDWLDESPKPFDSR